MDWTATTGAGGLQASIKTAEADRQKQVRFFCIVQLNKLWCSISHPFNQCVQRAAFKHESWDIVALRNPHRSLIIPRKIDNIFHKLPRKIVKKMRKQCFVQKYHTSNLIMTNREARQTSIYKSPLASFRATH